MSQIAKTPSIIKKEKELEELEKSLKKVNTDLKKLKTKYDKIVADMQLLRQEASKENPVEIFIEIKKLRDELVELWKKVNKTKGIERESKSMIKDIYEVFMESAELPMEVEDFLEQNEEIEKGRINPDSEHFRAKDPIEEILKDSMPKVDENEQKNIRKLFSKIANQLHPDKAKDKAQEEYLHQLMQKANEAYKRNDIATLLEMEEKFIKSSGLEDITPENNNALLSILDDKILLKKQELEMLLSQKERLKTQIDNINNSPIGQSAKQIMKQRKKVSDEELKNEMEGIKEEFADLQEIAGIIKYLMEEVMIHKYLTEEMIEKLEEYNKSIEEKNKKHRRGGHAEFVELDSNEIPEELMEMIEQMFNQAAKPQKTQRRRKPNQDPFDFLREIVDTPAPRAKKKKK